MRKEALLVLCSSATALLGILMMPARSGAN
jgi:hypothetical protein